MYALIKKVASYDFGYTSYPSYPGNGGTSLISLVFASEQTPALSLIIFTRLHILQEL